MKSLHLVSAVVFLSHLGFSGNVIAANYADRVVEYRPGIGFATEFGTGAGFTNTTAVLGEPARSTPGPFGGPVDPFSPPYLSSQLLSIGTGGSLTLGFGTPIPNRAQEAYGIDFLIFGSAGFVVTNGNFTGGGITDGSLFAAGTGQTRVSVSADNQTWFALDPALAPGVDSLYPTDGLGNFDWPVDPSLRNAAFSGLGLDGLRQLYKGSGGGAGFDISWARDHTGGPVSLAEVSFVRIEVLSDRVELDAISSVPEPSPWMLLVLGAAAFTFSACRNRNCRAVGRRLA